MRPIILLMLVFTLPCKGIVVDFNEIPNGTLVSANNPYAAILEIQAAAGTLWFNDELEPEAGIIWMESAISNGYLEVLPSFTVEDPSGAVDIGEAWYSTITATFLQPVTNASFDAFTYRHAVYRYTVVDANGVTSNVLGGETQDIPQAPFLFETFNLNIPEGGYLTSFELTNTDEGSNDWAAIWIDNIRFDLAVSPVSEAGSTGTLLGIVLGVMCLLKCKSLRHSKTPS
jgi:hypothetical protein